MPEVTSSGEPDAGNPHVRFEEGRSASASSYSTGSVTICKHGCSFRDSARDPDSRRLEVRESGGCIAKAIELHSHAIH